MIKKFFKVVVIIIFSIAFVVTVYVNFHPAFGGSPDKKSLDRFKKSKNYSGKKFKNIYPLNMEKKEKENKSKLSALSTMFEKAFLIPEDKNPNEPIDTEKPDLKTLKNGNFVWLGHSSIIMKTNNKIIMTDPVFYNASPVPGTVKPFEYDDKVTINDLPYVDIVLISHDHYDHLDYKAITEMKDNVGHFNVPLGVRAHLIKWGVEDEKITEYDWYDENDIENIKLVFTPSKHFSGRGLTNQMSTLWGSWVILSEDLKIYFSGDGGYSPEFKKIGDMFGGFDMAFVENGAYNTAWSDMHMFPKETAQAIIDLKARNAMPIHWGKFDLSTHKWDEPPTILTNEIEEYNKDVKEEKINLITARIGEIFTIENDTTTKWWLENNK